MAVVLAVIALVLVGFNERKLRINYHNACIRFAARYLQVANGGPASSQIENELLQLCYNGTFSAANSIQAHTDALLDMGYFVREEFVFHHRLAYEGTNRTAFHAELTKEFGLSTSKASAADWWSMQVPASNRIAVVTTPAQMVRWRKLVEEFDRPE